MSELETLTNYIQVILGHDNKLRKEAEGVLDQVKEKNVDQYFILLLQLLRISQVKEIRSFCAVMLRKQLSAFSEKNFNPCWYKINAQTAKIVKDEIFLALRDEPTSLVRYQICDFVGEIGGTIMNIDDDEAEKVSNEHKNWPELIKLIMELWGSKIDTMMEAALKILATLFTYVSDSFIPYKNDFYSIFKTGMECASLDIKTAAIEAMGSWLEIIETKHSKLYEDLVPLLMETVLFVLAKDEDKGVDCLGCIIDIVESEPRFFKKNFQYLFKTVQKICGVKEVEDDGIKQMAIQVLVSMMERIPKIFKENQQTYLKDFLEMTFAYMIESAQEASKEWMDPKEGFMEEVLDESDNAGVKFGSHVIDRLISVIGHEIMLPLLSGMVQQMMASPDWRFKFSALMSLSQVGEYVKNVDDIAPIAGLVLKYLRDSHPKIRFAALHVIGQIADDCQPEFQTKFHGDVIPALLNKLTEEVPRVLAHVLAALTNFLEGTPTELTKTYLEVVLNAVFPFVQKGTSLVRENALSAVAAAAESAREYYRPYFEKSVPIIYEIMKTHTQPEYKQLRGQCIECITLMGFSVGKEIFKRFASDIIELLVQIQKNDVAMDSLDPQRCYILSGWQRICLILEDEFVPYLQLVLPSLFKVIENILKAPQKEKEEDSSIALFATNGGRETPLEQMKEAAKKNSNTFEHEEAEVAINMVYVLITELKKYYFDYVESTTEIVLRALGYSQSEKIRRNAAKALPALIEVIKDSEVKNKDDIMIKISKVFIDSLWTTIAAELDPETILHMVHAIKDIIDLCGKFMTLNEIEETSARILKVLSDSDLRKAENENYKQEEECEEEEIEVLDDDNDQEEDLHVGLAELIGVLFKTHKELTLPLVSILYSEVLTKVLKPELSDKMHKFGIYLIDDMIEYLGIELIPNEWPHLSEALLKYATDKTCFVRQAALYGIGVLALKSKDAFTLLAETAIIKILEALKIQRGSESEKSWGFARDNAVSALGKIIQASGGKLNVELIIPEWLNHLPMQWDRPEGRKQHALLVDIILNWNAAIVMGQNGERLPKVVKIFATIIDTKFANEEIENKITKILRALMGDDKTKALLENACKTLTELQKQRLQKTIMKEVN